MEAESWIQPQRNDLNATPDAVLPNWNVSNPTDQ